MGNIISLSTIVYRAVKDLDIGNSIVSAKSLGHSIGAKVVLSSDPWKQIFSKRLNHLTDVINRDTDSYTAESRPNHYWFFKREYLWWLLLGMLFEVLKSWFSGEIL